jgi:hypothetical protein
MEDERQVVVRFGVSGRHGYGALEELLSIDGVASLKAQDAKQAQRVGMVRLFGEGLSISRFSFGQTPMLVIGHGAF